MFIDSHCHLDFCCFDEKRRPLLAQLATLQINKLIIPATQANGWDKITKLCHEHSALYYSLGFHPHFLDAFNIADLTLLKNKLRQSDQKCIALGEIGLDKFASAKADLQEFVFIEQLQIAEKLKLAIILHCVKKQSRVLALLKAQNFTQGGVYHAFSGSIEVATEFIKLGFKLGIGAVITYPNSTKTRETISKLPIESMVLETDSPDMPLYQQHTKNNSPVNIIPIFDALNELRKESKLQLATQLYKNVGNIFLLSDD
ncbi:MAG: TatD family hydrolase [Psychromonas sp.]